MFVDSDDWVKPDFCRIPYEKVKEYGADCVMFKYIWFEKGKAEEQKDYDSGLKSPMEAMNLVNGDVGLAPWNKLYKKSLFDNLRFPVGRIYEDIAVVPKFIHKAEKVYYINEPLYYYRARDISSTRLVTHKANKDMFEMSMERIHAYEEWGYTDMAYECRRWPCWTYLVREGRHSEYSEEALDYLLNLPEGAGHFAGSKKIMYYMLIKMPVLFDLICTLLGKRAKE